MARELARLPKFKKKETLPKAGPEDELPFAQVVRRGETRWLTDHFKGRAENCSVVLNLPAGGLGKRPRPDEGFNPPLPARKRARVEKAEPETGLAPSE